MSANNHKFPEECWDTFGRVPLDYNYHEVQEWFKRCMEDSPEEYGGKYDQGVWRDWYAKWFSQFRNMCQK